MLYLLDANVLIDANRDYYPLERVPEFWEWLIHMGGSGFAKTPIEQYEEVRGGTDDLTEWAKDKDVKVALLLKEEADVARVRTVVEQGYANDLTDDEVERIGQDPFLVAYALADVSGRCIVTTEVSKPAAQRANRHVPDICDHFGITRCDTFEFLRALNFSTGWRAAP